MNSKTKISIGIIMASLIGAGVMVSTSPTSPYKAELDRLQNQLNQVNTTSTKLSKESNNIKTPSIANVIKSTPYGLASAKATDFMTKLYTWSNGKEYTANRNDIIKSDITSADLIKTTMPEDKDISGNSQINSLGYMSEAKSVETYANDLNNTDLIVVAQVASSKTGSVDSDGLTNNQVYTLHIDPATQKIDKMSYLGKESLDNSTGNDDSKSSSDDNN